MKTLRAQIDIDASAERVWNTLTNIADYSTWNQFIPRLAGTLAPGERLEVRIEPPGGAAMTFRPTVLAVEAARELRWLGHLLVPGLFDGEHQFEIRPARVWSCAIRAAGALHGGAGATLRAELGCPHAA